MSTEIPAEDRRDTFALVTAMHSGDGDAMVGLILELAAAGRLPSVLFAATAHYVGLMRSIAPMLGVEVEFLIQQAALSGENPPA